VRPAGKGAPDKEAIILPPVFDIHANTGIELHAAGRFVFFPFAAGIVEFVTGPYTARGMERVFADGSGRYIAQPLRSAEKTRLCRKNTGHGP